MARLNDANSARIATIGDYLETIDGTSRSADDVVGWALDVALGMRPDIAAALAAGDSNG
jgi:hypothetical protein